MTAEDIAEGVRRGWLVEEPGDEHGPWYRFVHSGYRVRQRPDLPKLPVR